MQKKISNNSNYDEEFIESRIKMLLKQYQSIVDCKFQYLFMVHDNHSYLSRCIAEKASINRIYEDYSFIELLGEMFDIFHSYRYQCKISPYMGAIFTYDEYKINVQWINCDQIKALFERTEDNKPVMDINL